MVGLFRGNNPLSIVVLFVYGLFLRFAAFAAPHIPDSLPGDGIWFRSLLSILKGAGQTAPVIYPILAYLLSFIQAIALNNLVVHQRLLPRPNFLTAMSYLLITSFFPEWWDLSASLVVNTFMIWVWGRLNNLYNSYKAKPEIFITGLVLGVSSFFYLPSLAFILLILFALMTMRPFHVTEWLVALLGITTPYYFILAYLYLFNQWDPKQYLPSFSINYPEFRQTIQAWAGMLLLVIPFLVSGFFIQRDILKMLIQVRKSWSLLLFYLLLALLVPFVNSGSHFEYWVLSAIPFAIFHGNTFYNARKPAYYNVQHWAMVLFILVLNYMVLK